MKTRNIIITTIAVIALAATAPLYAQRGPEGDIGRHGGFGGGGPFDKGLQRLEHMLPRLADFLDLTADQQARIQAILDQELPAIQILRDQLRDNREAFMEGRDPGQFDEAEVRAFAQSQSSLHVEMAVASGRTKSQVYNVLTPAQQEKLGDLRGLMRDHRGHRHGRGQMKP